MIDQHALYEAVHTRVAARYKRRRRYLLNVIGTVGFNVLMWWLWTNTDPSVRLPIPECVLWIITFMGAVDIIKDSVKLLLGELEEWATQNEFERSLRLMSATEPGEKPKRDVYADTPMVVSDDGELVEEYRWEMEQKLKRG